METRYVKQLDAVWERNHIYVTIKPHGDVIIIDDSTKVLQNPVHSLYSHGLVTDIMLIGTYALIKDSSAIQIPY